MIEVLAFSALRSEHYTYLRRRNGMGGDTDVDVRGGRANGRAREAVVADKQAWELNLPDDAGSITQMPRDASSTSALRRDRQHNESQAPA